jgi:hypothetical protein
MNPFPSERTHHRARWRILTTLKLCMLILNGICALNGVQPAMAANPGGVQPGGLRNAAPAAGPTPPAVVNVCKKINSLLSQAVGSKQHPFSLLRSWFAMDDFQVADDQTSDKLGFESDGRTLVANVILYDHPLEVISYSSSGADPYQYEHRVQLWTRNLTSYIAPRDPAPEEGPVQEELIRMGGRPYFISYARVPGVAYITGIDSDLTSKHLCTLKKSRRANPDRIVSATAPTVCRAALHDHVDDLSLQDVVSYMLANLDTGIDSRNITIPLGEPVDLYNDGHARLVGMAMADGFTASRLHHYEWPVFLDADGTSATADPLNEIAFRHAGEGDNSARLFRYRGVTYYERWDPQEWSSDSDSASHEVWKFTHESAVRVCAFATDVIESFEIDKAAQPSK